MIADIFLGKKERGRAESYLVPAQRSDASIKELWFHVGTVILVAFDIVNTLGMPHLNDASNGYV